MVLFKARFKKNKIVFLSPEPFFRQLPDMKHVGIQDGKVDNTGWATFAQIEAHLQHAEDLSRGLAPFKVKASDIFWP